MPGADERRGFFDGLGLSCEVREKLLAFLQRNYPHSLPKVRAELQGTRSNPV
ncbi:MAG: hypothetical protein R2864_03085 [Syntrophotaleaceae bacterium]